MLNLLPEKKNILNVEKYEFCAPFPQQEDVHIVVFTQPNTSLFCKVFTNTNEFKLCT